MSTLSTTNLKNPSSGSNNIVLNADGTTTITAPNNIIKSGTAVSAASGVAIDFTGIPSWAKRVAVVLNQVSLSGTSHILIQVGSGTISATGYIGTGLNFNATPTIIAVASTAGFAVLAGAGSASLSGQLILVPAPGASNGWLASGMFARVDTAAGNISGGTGPNLSGALDRVRITSINGTDTFDGGSINILWEG